MTDLTDNELRAIAYFSIGVGSEGGDVAYQLSYAGKTTVQPDGSATLTPVQSSNSGYSIGTLQTDLGQHPDAARALVDAFQNWANNKDNHHQDWALKDDQKTQFAADLARDGNHIRDANFTADAHTYKGKENIPSSIFPQSGPDIDQTFKSHLNTYLATDEGKSFIHQRDEAQVNKLIGAIPPTLRAADFYKNATPDDQAKMFAMVAKAYNQSETFGGDILKDINLHKINSLDDISKEIDTFAANKKHPEKITYMQSGRDHALKGAELFNTLRNATEHNPIHDAWQAVTADPLVNPTTLGKDAAHPHLADQYATVKGTFVDPDQGRAFVNALEQGGSHNYGDPSSPHSRGFFSEGKDFVQWDRDGNGRAFLDGQWSEVSRSDLSTTRNADHTLDLNVTRDGQSKSLLHVTHPTGRAHATPDHPPAHGQVIHKGMHGDDVQKLQTQLGELGYLNNTGTPDGKFGPATEGAVKAFQHDHHMTEDGKAGPGTQKAVLDSLQPLKQDQTPQTISSPSSSAPGIDDPRNPSNSDHALFNNLKERFPDASENRLMQFTAECHVQGINDQNLQKVAFDQQNGVVALSSGGPLGSTALIDVKQPSPQPEQSIQQIQQYDQQQAQVQTQQAQINQQQQQQHQGPNL
jgi:hypothetical protein